MFPLLRSNAPCVLRNHAPMPPQQSIRGDHGVEFEQGFAPSRFGLIAVDDQIPFSVQYPVGAVRHTTIPPPQAL